jgi:hypothetical protein
MHYDLYVGACSPNDLCSDPASIRHCYLLPACAQVLDRLERRITALEGERRLLRRSAHSGGKADALALEGKCLAT